MNGQVRNVKMLPISEKLEIANKILNSYDILLRYEGFKDGVGTISLVRYNSYNIAIKLDKKSKNTCVFFVGDYAIKAFKAEDSIIQLNELKKIVLVINELNNLELPLTAKETEI